MIEMALVLTKLNCCPFFELQRGGGKNSDTDSGSDGSTDSTVCPAEAPDVAVALGTVPVIDGKGDDTAWSSATQVPMFKASKSTKEILGYAYIMYDCSSDTWFVKAEQLYPLEPGFCGPGQGCDQFVKMNGGGVLADPYNDGSYFADNMGWELSFPGSRKGVSGVIDLQVGVYITRCCEIA